MNENTMFLASIIGPIYLVLGLSVLIYAKQWKRITAELAKNHFIFLIGGIINLIIGLLIIQTHNIWELNLWVIITLTGWGAFLKGIFFFMAPESWIKTPLKWWSNTNLIRGDGLIITTLGATLSYYVYIV